MISQTRFLILANAPPVQLHDATGRTLLLLSSTGPAYIGNSTVSILNGFRLPPNQAISLDLRNNDKLFAIASSEVIVNVIAQEGN